MIWRPLLQKPNWVEQFVLFKLLWDNSSKKKAWFAWFARFTVVTRDRVEFKVEKTCTIYIFQGGLKLGTAIKLCPSSNTYCCNFGDETSLSFSSRKPLGNFCTVRESSFFPILFYYLSKLVRALWLVNLAGRTLLHRPLKFDFFFSQTVAWFITKFS